jgi:DNA-binding NtrC family response regulator
MEKSLKILIVDDNPIFLKDLKKKLAPKGLVWDTSSHQRALELLEIQTFDIAIIDLIHNQSPLGLEVLKKAHELKIYSIMLSDLNNDEYIRNSYEFGCQHYLTKDQFELILDYLFEDFLNFHRYRESSHQDKILKNFFKNSFITQDQQLKSDIEALKFQTNHKRPVLILGETGVGKGELAKLIHQLHKKTDKNPVEDSSFVPLNLSTISPDLLSSELFGSKKGSFTGALENKIGKLELAHEGTLFLDEIGSIPLSTQISLLKVIEDKSFYALGSNKLTQSNFQLVSATCDDLFDKMQQDHFRLDLFHRINAITIKIPPLRKRPEDIPLLIQNYLSQSPRKIHITPKAMEILKSYSWPGNIRQLKSTIENLIDLKKGIVEESDLKLTEFLIMEKIVEKKMTSNPNFPSGLPAIDLSEVYQVKNHVHSQNHNHHHQTPGEFLSQESIEFIERYGYEQFSTQINSEILKKMLSNVHGNTKKAKELFQMTQATFYRFQKKYLKQ